MTELTRDMLMWAVQECVNPVMEVVAGLHPDYISPAQDAEITLTLYEIGSPVWPEAQ